MMACHRPLLGGRSRHGDVTRCASGVVVVYPRGDWFGFITEQQVEKLLDNYIEHGSMVPEHWRGRMVPPPLYRRQANNNKRQFSPPNHQGIDKQEAKDLANSVTLAVETSS